MRRAAGLGLLLMAAAAGALWWTDRPDQPRSAPAPSAAPAREPVAGAANPDPTASGSGTHGLEPPASADSDQALMREARQRLETDPAAALALIERADARFGAADEARRALEIDAHVRLGRIGDARSLADSFYRTFPGSSDIARIERLTGYHPRPYGPRGR